MKTISVILMFMAGATICLPALAQDHILSHDNYQAQQILGKPAFHKLYLRHIATSDPATFVDVQFQRYDDSARRGAKMAILGAALLLGGAAAGAGAASYAINAENDCNPGLNGTCSDYSNDDVAIGVLTGVSVNAGITGLILVTVGIIKARRKGRIRDKLAELRERRFNRIRYEGLSLNAAPGSAGISASFSF